MSASAPAADSTPPPHPKPGAEQPWRLGHYFADAGSALLPPCCAADAAGCRVPLSPEEQQARRWGSGTATAAERPSTPRSPAFCSALQQFLATGVCWLEQGALPPATVDACRSAAVAHLATLREELARQKRRLLTSTAEAVGAHRTNVSPCLPALPLPHPSLTP
eukprot:COSAG04_NODE_2104_length_4778_cov_3.530883_6_plen_164_part_00